MGKFINILIFLALFVITQSAQAQQAEVVWFENDDEQYYIYIGHYDGQQWQQPTEPVYSSDVPVNSPTLATRADGETWLVWTQQNRLKTTLMSMRAKRGQASSTGQMQWSEAQQLIELANQNFAPSLIFDGNDVGWLFWSASDPELADIYLSKLLKSGWTKPIKVNKNNDVPDIVPMASLLDDGSVQVEWTTYDLQMGNYTLDSLKFLVETAPNSSKSESQELLDWSDIPRPNFVPSDRRVLLHFPNNKKRQTISLN